MNASTILDSDPPSTAGRWVRRILGAALLGVMILAVWSMSVSQFVTNALGLRIAFMAAVGIGALAGIATYTDPFYARDTPERAARLAKAPTMQNPGARMLLVGAFMGLMAFEAVNGAALEFWTLATGRPGRLTASRTG